jgi:hypothetical protein
MSHTLASVLLVAVLFSAVAAPSGSTPTATEQRASEFLRQPLPGAPAPDAALVAELAAAWERRPTAYVPRTRHLNPDGTPAYTNRLFLSTSPYLRQHAHNPVNWYPWASTLARIDPPPLVRIDPPLT